MYTDEQYSVLESFQPWNVHTFGDDPDLDSIVSYLISEKLVYPTGPLDDTRYVLTEHGKAILHRRAVALAESKKQADDCVKQAAAQVRGKKHDRIFDLLISFVSGVSAALFVTHFDSILSWVRSLFTA